MKEHATVIALALLLDAVIGDPRSLYARVAHPVVLVGRLVDALVRVFDRVSSPAGLLASGALVTLVVVGAAALAGAGAEALCSALPGGAIAEAILASTLVAFRGLHEHVAAVARGLAESLEAGRRAVSHIVGRDPRRLDRAGVARAAIESAAENFGDAVVAPVLAYLVLGLPGLCAYKAINTLDSMIGYRGARHEWLGKAAARLDDLVNWIPARAAALLLALAAALTQGASAAESLRACRRDAHRHRSVNAGWPEAAMAGALGIALAGPRSYGDEPVEDAWMGHGRRAVEVADVHRALALYVTATGLLAGIVLALALASTPASAASASTSAWASTCAASASSASSTSEA